MPVDNLARSDVITAATDESIQHLATAMDDEDVGSIVITDGDEPVGIVTDRDLTIEVLAAGTTPDDLVAEDVMSTDLCTIEHDSGFYRATELMSEHGVRRLPVTDGDGDLTGIITIDDLNELLADEHQQLADVVQAQRPPY
ncbi:CBS domain-containing protein [Natronorubrum sulfidifaciens]|uniref:Signal transduction protein with CBS domains n=1 Tax=Natronorubrum sulfidifaciens JCM 14089 TaxID=1230460 RepID=L9W470_9EURY|nr:CBS domain-containing protein [Natronorubrum sulfidifaciens]ELY44061.1 signal transduction protein with CBS domains [Natronorubrum sulfidifaciens JCM 14089]